VRARACWGVSCPVSRGVSLLAWRPLALVCTWPLGPVWAGYFCELCVGGVVRGDVGECSIKARSRVALGCVATRDPRRGMDGTRRGHELPRALPEGVRGGPGRPLLACGHL